MWGSWIIGFPWDTREELERGFRWLLSVPFDFLAVFYATPFARTELRRQAEAEGLLAFDDPNDASIFDVSIRVPAIPMDELRSLPDAFLRRFYLRPTQLARLVRRSALHPGRARAAAEIAKRYVLDRGYFGLRSRQGRRRQRFSVPAA